MKGLRNFEFSVCSFEFIVLINLLMNILNSKLEIKNSKLIYTAKEVPHPQVLDALGFLKVKPRAFNPFSQSICIPDK